MNRALPGSALIVAGLALAACQGPVNNEISIGTGFTGAFTPPTFDRDSNDLSVLPIWSAAGAQSEAGKDDAPTPSITGISREHWALTPIIVPNDLHAHNPVYAKPVNLNIDQPRNTGEYPTQTTSLDMPTDEGTDQQIAEAVVAPFASMLDVFLLPVRACVSAPWHITRTGTEPYRRGPGPGAYLAAAPRPPNLTLPPLEDPAAAPIPVQPVPPLPGEPAGPTGKPVGDRP